ncbi:MAG: carboxypeptidase regulatory-like domain-containing protein [Kofleriaceae bacterium]|nr:carboxypeptidase regulatory-like domain-containing protein [Myxococcales bacterium]MCB9562151.1 carboxypeptidase regulatory-like domain-containing protein [Kofleriaceae bacterium]
MKRPALLALVLALVVAAGAAWFLFFRKDHHAAAPSGPTATATPTGSGARDPQPAGERPRGDGADPRVLIDDDPVGTLRLEGQVIDDAQNPVGDAQVVLSSNPPRTIRTEADGSFAFDALVARPYELRARAPEGVAGPVTARLTDHSEPVILVLHAASSVTVEVVDDHGAPLDGATVELRGVDTQAATTAGGVATISPVVPGGYQVAAWADGFAPSYQFLPVAGDKATTRIALRRGAPVSGRVVTEDGAPVAGARVVYFGASDWSVQPDERLDGKETDADGRFQFEAVAAGSVRFSARHPDHAPGTSAIVTLDGRSAHDGVEVVLPAGVVVSGTVTDGAGAPVASARVRVGVAGVGIVGAPPRQVFSDADGAWQLKGVPQRQLEAVALAEAGASEAVEVDASRGDVAGVSLVIDVTGTIAGVVVDDAGEPLEGIQVSAGPDFRSGPPPDFSQWRLRGFPEDLTDAAGSFKLTGLAPGNYNVRATRSQRRGGGRRGFMGGARGTPAKTGDQNVRVVLSPDGGVKGKVVLEDGSPPTAFTIAVNFAPTAFATKDGSFQIDDLPPGDYEVAVRGNGFEGKSQRTTIESGKVADLGTIQVKKGRTIKGVVVADGTPVEGATVYVGRQIFGTGSSNKAEFGGPPGARDTRETTTDSAGGFVISGFGNQDLTIVAEHPDLGRSRAVRLVAGDPAEQALTVVIEPFGSLVGTVKEGDAVSEGVIVTAQPTAGTGAMYSVASGADGAFRLDRLAPDTYKVSAMTGMNPMRGMGFFSKSVAVEPGKETRVDVTIQKGDVTLTATAHAAGDAPVSGMGWIASGQVAAKNGREVSQRLAAQGEGTSSLSIMIAGNPATFRELTPGPYTVCLLPLPSGLQGMQAMGYAQRHGEDLPAFCKQVTVTAQPTTQAMTIEVEIPEVLPDDE